MDFCSEFYDKRAYFGGYPTGEQIDVLVRNGVNIFVDLTTLKERHRMEYDYGINFNKGMYINFPIRDNDYPKNHGYFYHFLFLLKSLIMKNPDSKIYVHCRGGHGRSGIVVSSLLICLFHYIPEQAVKLTTQFHDERPNLKNKWKGKSCPQTFRQRKFIYDFFRPFSIQSIYFSPKKIENLQNHLKKSNNKETGANNNDYNTATYRLQNIQC